MNIYLLATMFIIYGSIIIAGLFLFMQLIWATGIFRYFEINQFEQRLLAEWKKHGKIVIAVDFDDTLKGHTFTNLENQARYERTVSLLKCAKAIGAYIVLWTAAEPSRYDYMKWYIEQLGLEIDSINKNPIDLPFGNYGKIYANLFLDDRAGLNESLKTLENVIKVMEKL